MITIIVLYDDNSVETYVGALSEPPSVEKQQKIAAKLNAVIDGEGGSHEEGGRTVSFRTVTLDDPKLINIWR